MGTEQWPITLRCSSLDSLFRCAASVLAPGTRIKESNRAAVVGKVVHEQAAAYVAGGQIDLPDLYASHELTDAEAQRADDLSDYAARAWMELSKFFPEPRVEVVVGSDELDVGGRTYNVAGTCDVVSPVGTTRAIFLDWKTGFLDDGYTHQMNGYAYAIWCVLGKPDDVLITGVVVFCQHRYWRVIKWDKAKLEEWEYDLTHNVLANPDKYSPNAKCSYCELYDLCEARKATVQSTLDVLMLRDRSTADEAFKQKLDEAAGMLAAVCPATRDDPVIAETMESLRHRIALAESAIDDAKKMIRSAVERAGYLPIGDDEAMTLRECRRQEVVPGHALRELRRWLSDQQITECMTLSLPKLGRAYAQQRDKAKTIAMATKELEAALDAAGAIKTNTFHKLETVSLRDVRGAATVSEAKEQSNGDDDG